MSKHVLQALGTGNVNYSAKVSKRLQAPNPSAIRDAATLTRAGFNASLASRLASWVDNIAINKTNVIKNATTALVAINDVLQQMLAIATDAETGAYTDAQRAANLQPIFQGFQPFVADLIANTRTGPNATDAIALVHAAIVRVAANIARLGAIGEVMDSFSQSLSARQASVEGDLNKLVMPDISEITSILARLSRDFQVFKQLKCKLTLLRLKRLKWLLVHCSKSDLI